MHRDDINPGDIVSVTMRYEWPDKYSRSSAVFSCGGCKFTLPVEQVERVVARALQVDHYVRTKSDHRITGQITAISGEWAWIKFDHAVAEKMAYKFMTAQLCTLERINEHGAPLHPAG